MASSYSLTPIDIGTCMFTLYPRFCLLALHTLIFLPILSWFKLWLDIILVLRLSSQFKLFIFLRIEHGILCLHTCFGLLFSYPLYEWCDSISLLVLYFLSLLGAIKMLSLYFLWVDVINMSSSSLMLR